MTLNWKWRGNTDSRCVFEAKNGKVLSWFTKRIYYISHLTQQEINARKKWWLDKKKVRCRWVVSSNIGIGTMKGWELAKQDGCGVVGGSFHPNIVYSANFFWDFFSGHRVFFAEGQVFKSGDWNSRQYTYNNISINVCRNKVLLKLGRWLYNPSSTLKPALLQVPRQFHGVCCLVAVKPGDTGRYRRISQEPEKKNRKAHDNSTIICAKLKFFYLCDGYDLEIRITIWWVCERIIIEHCTWCVFSPKKVCVCWFFSIATDVFAPKKCRGFSSQMMWLPPLELSPNRPAPPNRCWEATPWLSTAKAWHDTLRRWAAAGVHHVVTVNGGIIWKIYNHI